MGTYVCLTLSHHAVNATSARTRQCRERIAQVLIDEIALLITASIIGIDMV
jgi:hypothetical protein